MPIFKWPFQRKSVSTALQLNDPRTIAYLNGGVVTRTGRTVTRSTALEVSAVLACIKVISQGVAQLPLHVVKADRVAGHVYAYDAPEYSLLSRRPNDSLHSFAFREYMTSCALLTGSAMALITRGVKNQPLELIPLQPGWVTVLNPNARGADVRYQITSPTGIRATAPASDVFHLRGPMLDDDYFPTDVLSLAREAVGLAMATEETHSRLHSNGVRMSGVLSTEQTVSQEAIKALKEAFRQDHSGTGNVGKVAVLDQGYKFTPLSMVGKDAEHVETRKMQIEEICRFFGVFPQMIMANSGIATYASAESFFGAHLEHTLDPWLCRWTAALDMDVLPPKLGAYFDTSKFRRATLIQRSQSNSILVQAGIKTRNEVRAEEGLSPLDGLDEPLTPMNMISQTARQTAPDPTGTVE